MTRDEAEGHAESMSDTLSRLQTRNEQLEALLREVYAQAQVAEPGYIHTDGFAGWFYMQLVTQIEQLIPTVRGPAPGQLSLGDIPF